MKYEHDLDNLIVYTLHDKGITHFNRLQEITGINKRTLSAHLKKLCHPVYQIVIKDDRRGKGNEYYYSLNKNTEVELEYHIFEGIKTQREARKLKEGVECENQAEIHNRIYISLLTQASRGSTSSEERIGDIKPGDILKWDSSRMLYVPHYSTYNKGVTIEDLVKNRDYGNAGAFRTVTFTETQVIECVDRLKKDGFYNLLRPILRDDGSREVGIEIGDDRLRNLIDNIACLISPIKNRIQYTWRFIKKPKRDSWEFKWYVYFFGKEGTINLIKDADYKRPSLKLRKNKEILLDYIKNNLENEGIVRPNRIELEMKLEFGQTLQMKKDADLRIMEDDRYIVELYHQRILCDKYEDRGSERERSKYDIYCKFVRDVLYNTNNKYYGIMNKLIDLVYPKPLQRLHNTDLNLVKYVKNIPDNPTKEQKAAS